MTEAPIEEIEKILQKLTCEMSYITQQEGNKLVLSALILIVQKIKELENSL